MKHLLIKRLALISRSHRQEHISTDKLMHYFAVGRMALEGDVLFLESHLHLFDLPVDRPRVDVLEAPGFHGVAT